MLRLLILGGTTEASALAAALAGDARFAPLLSFAGATRAPRPPPIPHRIGGFGGAAGLAAFLRTERIALLVDATHPFATQMKRHAAEAASIPAIGVLRPLWVAGAGDRWTEVDDMPAACAALGQTPRRVLLTIGQKDLPAFDAAPWHRYLIRSVDPPGRTPPLAEIVTARGPFDLAAELDLLRRHRIEALVTKNSGGSATAAKLEAARMLGVAVVMLRRPPPPALPCVADAEAALRWLHAHAERGV